MDKESYETGLKTEYSKQYKNILELQQALSQKEVTYNPDCIRSKSNWSSSAQINFIDDLRNPYGIVQPDGHINYELFEDDSIQSNYRNLIAANSPKLVYLMEKIKALDAKDMEEHGKKFKHFIFTDLKSRRYGLNVLGSGLLLDGWRLGYHASASAATASKKFGPIEFASDATLEKTPYYNFYIMTSRAIYDQSITSTMKRSILGKFNERPHNVYGKYVRIIIMDSGFKEGIDLFDIKYIHVFEPQETLADLKQVIGRGTRTCGQKGLPFDPQTGWPLHVYIYDMVIPQKLAPLLSNSRTAFDLYLNAKNKDLRLYNFIASLELAVSSNAVDAVLTAPIHGGRSGHVDETVGNGQPPNEAMSADKLKNYIKKHFGRYTWDIPKIENGCVDDVSPATQNKHRILNFTKTQGFVSNYFTPQTYVKGMLLWHSVGTGKTCTAIATASKTFEAAGYTILWVTRTTLKSDIWKNIFGKGQSCHEGIRSMLSQSNADADAAADVDALNAMEEHAQEGASQEGGGDIEHDRSLLSSSWAIPPISYKQLTNLIEHKNNIYEKLVKLNGKLDPLKKTLLIIDEAHKLYGATDLPTIEQPNMEKLHEALMNSYELSGPQSVRVLLMTATPITQHPMEIIQLLNLLRPIDDQMPALFPSFAEAYLKTGAGGDDGDGAGQFSEEGERKFANDLAGYVSYLNLEKDIRKFAQPIIHQVINAPLVDNKAVFEYDKRHVNEYYKKKMLDSDLRIAELEMMKTLYPGLKTTQIENIKAQFNCGQEKGVYKKVCNNVVNEHLQDLKEQLNKDSDHLNAELKDLKTARATMVQEKATFLKSINKTLKAIGWTGTAAATSTKKTKTVKATKATKATKKGGGAPLQIEEGHQLGKSYFMGPFYEFKTECRNPASLNKRVTEYLNSVPSIKNIDEKIEGQMGNIAQTQYEVKLIKAILARMKRAMRSKSVAAAAKSKKKQMETVGTIEVTKTFYEENVAAMEAKKAAIKEHMRKIASLRKTRKTETDKVLKDLKTRKKREAKEMKEKVKRETKEYMEVVRRVKVPAEEVFKYEAPEEGEQSLKEKLGLIKTIKKTIKNAGKERKVKVKTELRGLSKKNKKTMRTIKKEVDSLQQHTQNLIEECIENIKEDLAEQRKKIKCPDGKVLNPVTLNCVKAPPK